jgi:hypothetical protein
MAAYELTLDSAQLSGLLTSDKGLQGLVETGVCPTFYTRGGPVI